MQDSREHLNMALHHPGPLIPDETGQDLLSRYLALPMNKRREQFAGTARTAELTGVAQRTIQLWIEIGAIQAIQVGRKYQVSLDSVRKYLMLRNA